LKILFLIRILDSGGAERQLIELVKHLDKSLFTPVVVTFYDGGLLQPELENNSGVNVFSLGKKGRWDLLSFIKRLLDIVAREKPDVIHGYLDVPNLFSLLVGKLSGKKVVWGLRASNLDLTKYDWTAGFIFRLSAWLSFLPDAIIVNSNKGMDHHAKRGFFSKRMTVIFNGIDLDRFYLDLEEGQSMRKKWGIADDCTLIGQVGRLDPMKDLPNYLKAASKISQIYPDVRFVQVGNGPAAYRAELEKSGNDLGLQGKLVWVRAQTEMRAVYNALDLMVLSSSGEGFPNVVGEAMACQIPCVVTDVGDASLIIGKEGVVVAAGDASALAQAMDKVIAMPVESRKDLGLRARARIEACFGVQTLAEQTGKVILDLFTKES